MSRAAPLFADKYRLVRLLGRGGMGEVWLAIEEGPRKFRREVALKRLLASTTLSSAAAESLLAEATVIARIDHPNIVRLIELGSTEEGTYLALDYVDGAALDTIYKRSGPLSPKVVALIGLEIARALDAVHSLCEPSGESYGVVHRDVTPANILVGRDGRIRLTDFGVARISGMGGDRTEAGVFKGKLGYMAPEQALGHPFDGRADVFSLGITLYEGLLGRRVRLAETASQLVLKVATMATPPVRELVPGAPDELAAAIDGAAAFDAEVRTSSAGELADHLAEALRRLGPGAENEARNELMALCEAAIPSAPRDGNDVPARADANRLSAQGQRHVVVSATLGRARRRARDGATPRGRRLRRSARRGPGPRVEDGLGGVQLRLSVAPAAGCRASDRIRGVDRHPRAAVAPIEFLRRPGERAGRGLWCRVGRCLWAPAERCLRRHVERCLWRRVERCLCRRVARAPAVASRARRRGSARGRGSGRRLGIDLRARAERGRLRTLHEAPDRHAVGGRRTPLRSATAMRQIPAALCALILVAAPTAARAGGPDASAVARAAAMKAEADGLFDQRRYAEAHSLYRKAYALSRDPALLYNEGRSLEAMGEYPEAIAKLEAFAAAAPPKMRARVPTLDRLLASIRARVASLEVRCNVAGAKVLVRGRVLGTVEGTLKTAVRAGAARIEVIADGYDPFSEEVDLGGNATLTLDVTLREKRVVAFLDVRAEPSGSLVFIGERPYGPAPVHASLAPGLHTLRVERSGYVVESYRVTLSPGERRELSVTLHEPPPVTSKWWFWTGVGVAVVGATVVTTALLVERPAGSGSFSPGQIRW